MIRVFAVMGLSLLLIITAMVWPQSQQQEMWCEIVGDDLVRVHAKDGTVQRALDATLSEFRAVTMEDGIPVNDSLQAEHHSWLGDQTSPDFVRLQRHRIQQEDANGHRLAVEYMAGIDMPTLVMISYDDPRGARVVSSELVRQLQQRGVELL